jgi:hypothetical protein
LTIFEMLEKLETEIVSLQARYQDLASSLHHTAANGNAISHPAKRKPRPVGKKKAVRAAARKAKPKAAAPSKLPDFEQLELQVQESPVPTDQQPSRVLGKRQALGKSLVQLRKMSAWRSSRNSEE